MPQDLIRPRRSYDFVVRDTQFVRIQDIGNSIRFEVLQEFYEQVIANDYGKWMFPRFSHLYVLVASYGSEQYCKPEERTWKNLLSSEQYEFLKCYDNLIIGYLMVNENTPRTDTDEYHLLDFIDTRVRGLGLAAYMLSTYLDETQSCLIPLKIIHSAEKYWQRYMDDMDIDPEYLIQQKR
jgi:hypothetical protein|tara:strand:- start:1465 stop:2004 length:540 start_codon:yes stop_codon:yes gene_type:complete